MDLRLEHEAVLTAMLKDRGYDLFEPDEDKLYARQSAAPAASCLEVVFVHNLSLPETRKYADSTPRLFVCKTTTSRAMKAVPSTNQIWLTKALKIAGVFKDHRLMPKHRLLSAAESAALDHARQWPKIKATDPMSRYYGATPGDVFRIEEVSFEGTKVVRYRSVVA